jgi:predicted Zn-dependent peptidase
MRYSFNNLELALWMESERLLHPIINQIGRHAERGYQEEKNSRYDNQPYGKILPIVKENMFESHPYRWSTIGSMEHLDTIL